MRGCPHIWCDTYRWHDGRWLFSDTVQRYVARRGEPDRITCMDCGAWLPLGPARDDERTAVEVRAAELAIDYVFFRGYSADEWYGRLDADGCMSGVTTASDAYWAGWLSAAIHAHHDEQSKEGM